jgi:hypothetical protein
MGGVHPKETLRSGHDLITASIRHNRREKSRAWALQPRAGIEGRLMKGVWLMLFAVTAGFTASGIVANLYRLSGARTDTSAGWLLRAIVMVIAGPSVIFESAVRGFIAKEWKPMTFWLVLGGIGYWSLALGLFVIELAVAL